MICHVCPWWLGYVISSPLRRIFHKPELILQPFVAEGMTALDVGCGMGYFSLEMARRVGPTGRVVCVDLQPRMLASLEHRAAKAGLLDRLVIRPCSADDLGVSDLANTIDFAVAFHMVHEVPDAPRLLTQIHLALKIGARLLLVEPAKHVSEAAFLATLDTAQKAGFTVADRPVIRQSMAAVLGK